MVETVSNAELITQLLSLIKKAEAKFCIDCDVDQGKPHYDYCIIGKMRTIVEILGSGEGSKS